MIGWVSTGLTLLGAWYISSRARRGYLLLITGNVLWLIDAVPRGYWSFAAMNVVFLTVHVHGWFNWRKL